jgi:signal transduction histidine kinase
MDTQHVDEVIHELAALRELFQAREHEFENFVHNIQVNVQGILTDAELLMYGLEREIVSVSQLTSDAQTLLSKILLLLVTTNNIHPNLGAYDFATTDLDRIISSGIEVFQSMAADKGVAISYVNVLGSRAMAEVSRNHLQHAVHNLLHNAVKYSYSRSTRDRTVDIVLRAYSSDFWLLKITNYGVLIEKDEIPRLTENGFRGVHSRDRFRTGSGLGLFIVNNIVRDHSGWLTIKSRPVPGGAGVTTVEMFIPFSQRGGNRL